MAQDVDIVTIYNSETGEAVNLKGYLPSSPSDPKVFPDKSLNKKTDTTTSSIFLEGGQIALIEGIWEELRQIKMLLRHVADIGGDF